MLDAELKTAGVAVWKDLCGYGTWHLTNWHGNHAKKRVWGWYTPRRIATWVKRGNLMRADTVAFGSEHWSHITPAELAEFFDTDDAGRRLDLAKKLISDEVDAPHKYKSWAANDLHVRKRIVKYTVL